MRVFVVPDYQTLSREAALLVRRELQLKPDCVLGLPTGRTPQGMYEELARMHREGEVDFSQVRAFGLDEYVGLSPSDPRSFTAYLQTNVVRRTNLQPRNFHMPTRSYEAEIAGAGGMDLLIAGIGINGHIAFNEPGSPFDSTTRVVSLADATIEPLRRFFAEEELPRRGLTMGIATILSARSIILLASGPNKAPALAAGLQGTIGEANPASALQSHSDVVVIADREAFREWRGGPPA